MRRASTRSSTPKRREHLFRVAAGIDSMVLGESQILGQVRDAMSAATEAGTLNGVLSSCSTRRSASASARARRRTSAATPSRSAPRPLRWRGRQPGRSYGQDGAGDQRREHGQARGPRAGRDRRRAESSVANRTLERAQELAREIGPGAQAMALARPARRRSPSADIVISGTGADGFILGPDDVRPVMAGRNGRGLLFIDIAVPRDIDPAVRRSRACSCSTSTTSRR